MARQQEIPGMEHPHGDKKLDAMIDDRRKASKKRKKYNDQETDLAAEIQAHMEEKGHEVYVATTLNPPIRVRLSNGKKKVVFDEYDDANDVDDDDDIEEAGADEQKAKRKSTPAEAA